MGNGRSKSAVTGWRVVRTLRRQQHLVAFFEHLNVYLQRSLSDAYGEQPTLAVEVGGVVQRADDAVVEALAIEFAQRAEEAKRKLAEMLGGDVSKLELVHEDEDEEDDEAGLQCSVVPNPEVQEKERR